VGEGNHSHTQTKAKLQTFTPMCSNKRREKGGVGREIMWCGVVWCGDVVFFLSVFLLDLRGKNNNKTKESSDSDRKQKESRDKEAGGGGIRGINRRLECFF
jgi:hypothetical protein